MIKIQNVSRDFHTDDRAVAALGGIDLEIARGAFTVLLGPSGSGKTTLLRCIAGLETPDDGEIEIDGESMFSAKRNIVVPPERRRLGMVFQSYAVWPHMTVAQNIALPLTHGTNRIARSEIPERVQRALAAVKLQTFGSRPTTMLSGGQQQRVALARALAIEPRALLMDEPLSNLDARLREEIRVEIKAVVKDIGVTVLYVTHDQGEAMALADQIAVMDAGRIVQLGSPTELYRSPSTSHVAEFFGSINWIAGIVTEIGRVETSFGVVAAPKARTLGPHVLGIRPEDLRLRFDGVSSGNAVTCRVINNTFLGDCSIVQVRTAETVFSVKISGDLEGLSGIDRDAWIDFPADKIHVFPAGSVTKLPADESGSFPSANPPQVSAAMR
jgi:iron(III) transport system ATP-binding protein